MTGKETKAVLALLRAAYPNFYKNQTREDLLAVVNLWQKQFEEYDGNGVGPMVTRIFEWLPSYIISCSHLYF